MQELDVAFRAVVDNPDDLDACLRLRDVVLAAMAESWPGGVWLEDVVRQGIYCGYILVVKHQRYEEALPMIKRVFGVVLDKRWMDGGPYGRVETQDARECSRLIAVCESNLRPPEPSPAARPNVPDRPRSVASLIASSSDEGTCR